jgi:D-proline reductase (dithiol) PrdB
MVRLSSLPQAEADGLGNMPMPEYEPTSLVEAPALNEARVALISTAGLHRADDRPFLPGANDYRVIPGDVDFAELHLSHVSVNFDRSGFQQDANTLFPLERLRALARAGEIGSVADWHYSFMGATSPEKMEETGGQVAKLLREDGVTSVLLVPV